MQVMVCAIVYNVERIDFGLLSANLPELIAMPTSNLQRTEIGGHVFF